MSWAKPPRGASLLIYPVTQDLRDLGPCSFLTSFTVSDHGQSSCVTHSLAIKRQWPEPSAGPPCSGPSLPETLSIYLSLPFLTLPLPTAKTPLKLCGLLCKLMWLRVLVPLQTQIPKDLSPKLGPSLTRRSRNPPPLPSAAAQRRQ